LIFHDCDYILFITISRALVSSWDVGADGALGKDEDNMMDEIKSLIILSGLAMS
jgi:hypothetical protein